ncbi:MAG: hypothetical protein U0746_14785 [Gemmataceae bacterium]
MKRKAGALVLLTALGGCMSADKQPAGPNGPAQFGGVTRAQTAPGYQGPWGEPVNATTARPATANTAVVQASATAKAADSGVVTADMKSAAGSVQQTNYAVKRGTSPGMTPPPPGAVAALGALPGVPTGGTGYGPGIAAARTSVRFTGPAGMKVSWLSCTPANKGFSPAMVEAPGRYNFIQGGVYQLKLSDIPNRPALDLYPTLEIRPCTARTATFLAHCAVPIGFTEEDFEQVAAGNFVIKVVYLPDPQYQDLAVAGPDEVVSSRLEPGVDPILEAERRGAILAIIRIGNIDLEAPNTPPLGAPPATGGLPGPFGGMPMMTPPGVVPPGVMPQGPMPVPGAMPAPGLIPPSNLPPGVVPPANPPIPPMTPPGTPPVTTPPPAVTPVTPAAPGLSANPNAGRSAVISPVAPPLSAPPAMKLPDLPGSIGGLK